MKISISTSFSGPFFFLPWCQWNKWAFHFSWGWTFINVTRRPKGFIFSLMMDNESMCHED